MKRVNLIQIEAVSRSQRKLRIEARILLYRKLISQFMHRNEAKPGSHIFLAWRIATQPRDTLTLVYVYPRTPNVLPRVVHIANWLLPFISPCLPPHPSIPPSSLSAPHSLSPTSVSFPFASMSLRATLIYELWPELKDIPE